MMKYTSLVWSLWPVLLTVSAAETASVFGRNGITLPQPPPSHVQSVTDDVGSRPRTDLYRWLENGKSPETRAWIDAQIKYTARYLDQLKNRPEIAKRLSELLRVESYSIPIERQDHYFFTKRLPDENQASIYRREGLMGKDQRLIDPRQLSADPDTSVQIDDLSKAGDLLVYGVREGGADEQTVRMRDVKHVTDLADVLPRARYGQISLSPDGQGLYYSKLEKDDTSVYYHRLGTPATEDTLVFGKEFNGEKFGPMELIGASVTENERYLLIEVHHGVPAKRVDVYAKDLRTPDAPIRPILHGIDSRFQVENHDDDLYALTDDQAPNYRVIKIDLNHPAPDRWQTVIPERKDVISEISIVGGKLFVTRLHDVVTQTQIYSLAGQSEGELQYPTLGSASGMIGRDDSGNGFYRFQSFILPPTICHYDVASGKTEIFAKPQVPFSADQYEVKQVFFTSKDGTRVPMFISSRRGLPRDGTARALMFAYGGFNVSLTAHWDPEYAWWMEQGGFYAQPNLRGGGEYGETWHHAGMFEKKQNVFDDFFGAAEYLIAHHYTTAAHLAIRGRSNGGLLMGAAMTQRPDLFGAIWCGYPLLDMIRFQKFLVGRWWTAEYGCSENPEQVGYLLNYSPYQNVKPGTPYPAIMFNTGDSDTRVDPLHARKMAALMQASTGSHRPILLHYELKAGHSSGVSIDQLVQDTTDELGFLWNETE
jgi:prolyl oligopeptidase